MSCETWVHHNVADNVHDIIRLTDLEFSIANGPLFNRLHYVYQDSTVFFIWPTARTQRYEHSIGTMHLAGLVFFNALGNAEADVVRDLAGRFKNGLNSYIDESNSRLVQYGGVKYARGTSNEIKNYISCCGKQNLYSPELQSYSHLVPSSVPPDCFEICMILAEGLRLAGMLHDLGHPPMSHVCEYVLKEQYKALAPAAAEVSDTTERNVKLDYVAGINRYLNGSTIDEKDLHEAIGNSLAELAIGKGIASCNANGVERDFLFAAGYAAIAMLNDVVPFNMLHSIVSSTVDVDRLDYVQRDSKATAVGSDALQYARIVEGVRLMKRENGSFVFAYPEKTVETINDFLRKRFTNYKTIIFHHRVVKMEEMLKAALLSMSARYFKDGDGCKPDMVKDADDYYVLPDDISGLWSPLIVDDGSDEEKELSFFQWNDSWLLTMLRKECTRLRVFPPKKNTDTEKLSWQLNELFFAEKSYETVVKRPGDCRVFRRELAKLILDSRERHENKLIGLLQTHESHQSSAGAGEATPGDGPVGSLLKILQCDDPNSIPGLFAQFFDPLSIGLTEDNQTVNSFEDFVKDEVERVLGKLKGNYSDVIVARNHIKPGVKGGIDQAYLFNKRGELLKLEEVSTISTLLINETADMPAFFTFVHCNDDATVSLCHQDRFFEALAERFFILFDTAAENIDKYVIVRSQPKEK